MVSVFHKLCEPCYVVYTVLCHIMSCWSAVVAFFHHQSTEHNMHTAARALIVCALVYSVNAAIPSYYQNIDPNAKGETLRAQLTDLINPHTVISYDDVWDAFNTIDSAAQNSSNYCPVGSINDIYSAKCWTYPDDQCGNYQKEGDCYNREHSFPKSWWNGSVIPAYTDMFHLYPSDGYDNNVRANDPLGTVDPNQVIYVTSSNCLSGPCIDLPGQNCWEPADKWKGELARTYFYISVSYRDTFTCCETPGTSNAILKPWMLKTLLDWHNRFPATQYELDRNELIFNQIQQNRNPFIDVPQWADAIWSA